MRKSFCAAQLHMEKKGRKRYPTIIYAMIILLNGDCLTRNARQGYA